MHGKHEQQRRPRSRARRRRLPSGAAIAAIVAAVVVIILSTRATSQSEDNAPEPAPAPQQATLVAVSTQPTPDVTPELPTPPAPSPDPEPAKTCRFSLTPEERDLTERVVMAEAGGESYEGQMAVAQCILNACEKTGGQPSEVVLAYQYAKPAEVATQSVRDAVAAVFDDGDTVTTEPIMFFYAPRWTDSPWHETQRFVMEIGGHRFFAEKGAK